MARLRTFATVGTYTLALGVAGRGDFVMSTVLQVDNVALLPVPEADGLWLALASLKKPGGLSRVARRPRPRHSVRRSAGSER